MLYPTSYLKSKGLGNTEANNGKAHLGKVLVSRPDAPVHHREGEPTPHTRPPTAIREHY